MAHKNAIDKNVRFNPVNSIDFMPGAVVSRQILKNKSGNITVFAFDEGEELSEHTAPFDAVIHVLEGELKVTIGGKPNLLSGSEAIIMEAGIPHSLVAATAVKFILTMIKGE